MQQTFEVKLEARGPGGAWTYMRVPFDVVAVFGSKARVAVAGTINGFPFRNSLMPEGDGTHSMMVNKQLQAGAHARAGDTVTVSLDRDDGKRDVATPDDLEHALRQSREAAAMFAGLSFSQKKDYIDWITGAKQETTRANRIGKAIGMLAAGHKAGALTVIA